MSARVGWCSASIVLFLGAPFFRLSFFVFYDFRALRPRVRVDSLLVFQPPASPSIAVGNEQ